MNDNPNERQPRIVIGVDVIKDRVEFDKQRIEEFNTATENTVISQMVQTENKMRTDLVNKIKRNKEGLKTTSEKILKLEEKFLILAKRTNSYEIQANENAEIQHEIDNMDRVCESVEKNIEDINYYIDHKRDFMPIAESDRSVRTNERLQNIFSKNQKNGPIDFLEKMRDGLKTLSGQLTQAERDIRQLGKTFEE
jgi:hypothetical protein